jgi:hypothetical protein
MHMMSLYGEHYSRRMKAFKTDCGNNMFCGIIMSDDIKDIERIAHIVYDAIFQNQSVAEIDGIVYPIVKTSKSKIRLIEYDGLSYIEQNPHKSSRWAEEAREGHRILWVMQGRRYLARIRDEKFLDLRKSKERD